VSRVTVRRIRRIASWQVDTTGSEEVGNAVLARLAVDVAQVVGHGVERHEWLAPPSGTFLEERVEEPLPGAGVHRRGAGHDAVEVEHDGIDRPAIDKHRVCADTAGQVSTKPRVACAPGSDIRAGAEPSCGFVRMRGGYRHGMLSPVP